MIGNCVKDGPPDTFNRVEGTEIPQLQSFVYEAAVRRRYEAIVRYCGNLQHFIGK
jgi:hypothetical protein